MAGGRSRAQGARRPEAPSWGQAPSAEGTPPQGRKAEGRQAASGGALASTTYAERSRWPNAALPPCWGAPEHGPVPPGNKQRIREASWPKKSWIGCVPCVWRSKKAKEPLAATELVRLAGYALATKACWFVLCAEWL